MVNLGTLRDSFIVANLVDVLVQPRDMERSVQPVVSNVFHDSAEHKLSKKCPPIFLSLRTTVKDVVHAGQWERR